MGEDSETEHYVWYVEWRELTARLAHLDRAHRDGVMSPDQRARYRDLRRELRRHVPLLKQCNLCLPSVPL